MRILVCHNFYQQPGGEDEVFNAEVNLLQHHGHDVHTWRMDNDSVNAMGKLQALSATLWNRQSYREVRRRVEKEKIEVVHFHNTFPLISPSAYYAARNGGAAVVQTLHNFRLLCPGANLFREGSACEKCVGRKLPLPGIVHKCYRGSRSASAAVAALIGVHHAMGTWRDAVDLYLTPTEFARQKFLAGGFPVDKLRVKPNFLDPDPGLGKGDGGYAIFVARLSHEKGLETLLEAWRELPFPLKIIGDGPLAPSVADAVARMPNIQWLGRRPLPEVLDTIGGATVCIFPSRCYETFGRVAVEAFAKGVPVIASGHGAPGAIVSDGVNGLHFEPGDGRALAAAVRRIFSNPAMHIAMRIAARREYEEQYTGAANHAMLMSAYRQAIENSQTISTAKAPDYRVTPLPLLDDGGIVSAILLPPTGRRNSTSRSSSRRRGPGRKSA